MRNHFPLLLLLLLISTSCKQNTLNVRIKYDQIYGLTQGNRVIFEQNHIGDVTGASYNKDGYYMVDIAIKEAFTNAATQYSKFYIIDDPLGHGSKAIEVTHLKTGGKILVNGQVVDGSSEESYLFEGIEKNLGKTIGEGFETLRNGFENLFEDLKGIPDDKGMKALREELENLSEEMKHAGKIAKERIEKEVIPRLRDEIEKLRKRLQKLDRDKEIEELEVGLKKLTEV